MHRNEKLIENCNYVTTRDRLVMGLHLQHVDVPTLGYSSVVITTLAQKYSVLMGWTTIVMEFSLRLLSPMCYKHKAHYMEFSFGLTSSLCSLFCPSLWQVNGLRVALPHSPSPLMSLSLAGQYITLQTTFGLRVRWDGNHYAQISVPRSVWRLEIVQINVFWGLFMPLLILPVILIFILHQ